MADLSLLLDRLAELDPESRASVLTALPEAQAAVLVAELDARLSTAQAHLVPLLPHQRPPDGDEWDGWLLLGGRGAGKTYAGSRWIGDLAANVRGLRARIIAPTLADAVNSVVLDPQSGIIAAHPEAVLKTSGPEGTRVVWPNGSTIWCVGTNAPKDIDRLRALTNIDADYFEEAAANPHLAEAVDQAALSRRGNRLPRPLWIATTTPRALLTIKAWAAGGVNGETVIVTRASTLDNPHTPAIYRTRAERLRGTRLHRQEVLGEILEDVEGALWTLNDLTRSTYAGDRQVLLSALGKVLVGVDPPSGPGTCGIIVIGRSRPLLTDEAVAAGVHASHLYVLDDYSITDASPNTWAGRVVQAVTDYDAAVVAEVNQGGRMVTEVLTNYAVTHDEPALPVTTVHAAVGKQARAEPIALLWEAELQTAHIAPETPDALTLLVDQLTGWVPGDYSPDRLDAMCWGMHKLRKPDEAVLYTGPRQPSRPSSTPSLAQLRGGGL